MRGFSRVNCFARVLSNGSRWVRPGAYWSVALALPEQLRQLRDVDGDAARLVRGEHLRLARLALAIARVNEGERLPVGVPDSIAARHGVGVPRRGRVRAA
jgi:hypothetical protein